MKKHIFILLVAMYPVLIFGQFMNFGNLQLHTGSSLNIQGDFTNLGSAVLLNDGNLFLRGNVSNAQAGINTGNGTVHFIGSARQVLSGAAIFKSHHLVTNNIGGLELQNNLGITGNHTFTNGMIITTGNYYLHYEAGATYTGDQDNRHVNGRVRKTGNTDFQFPVGNGVVERKITFQNLSSLSEFEVQHREPAINKNQFNSPLIAVDSFEYWTTTKISGGAADVAMNWDNSKISFPAWPVNGIKVASFDGTHWNHEGGTASGTSTAGSVTATGITIFNGFSFGLVSAPLPLILLDFNAAYKHDHTLLTWKTMQEQNVSHFLVERSNDGSNFYTVDNISAANIPALQHYRVMDYKPIHHNAWYRLRIVDIDRKEQFSKSVLVSAKSEQAQLFLKTNPVISKQVVLTSTHNITSPFKYQLITTLGQVFSAGQVTIQQGDNILQAALKMPPGHYYLYLENGTTSFKFKLFVP